MKDTNTLLSPFERENPVQRKVENKLECSCDSIWQVEPERILTYKPFNLHYYGWIPFPFRRNFHATVFSELYIYTQGAFLTTYMAVLHLTGFGIRHAYLHAFVMLLGTFWVGAVINISTLITFILVLFTTLMIQRWFDIRSQYFKIRETTIDVCMTLSHIATQESAQLHRAQVELTRLLNLAHLLLLIKSDAETTEFQKSIGAKTALRKLSTIYSHKEFEEHEHEDSEESFQFLWHKRMRELNYEDLHGQGLVNKDEWDLIMTSEQSGVHGFEIVYSWTKDLLMKCGKSESMKKNPESFSILVARVNMISENASSLLAAIGSQMPYPYAHLVSFVVHVCLFLLATWLGSLLHCGQAGETFTAIVRSGMKLEVSRTGNDLSNDTWTVFWCYLFLISANFLFQGLLNLHELLDNPFGVHCAKFPVQSNVIEVLNVTRALLESTKSLPSSVINATEDQDGYLNSPWTPQRVRYRHVST
eukprot:g786.t1